MRSFTLSILAAALLGLAALAPAGARASTAAAHPASSPRQAVKILLSSVASRQPLHGGCHPFMGTNPAGAVATCPITPRLRYALLHTTGALNPICRCQNPPRQVVVMAPTTTSTGTYVEGYFDYGPNSFVTTYVVVHQSGGWLVDDMYCLRHPETSVYTKRGGMPCP